MYRENAKPLDVLDFVNKKVRLETFPGNDKYKSIGVLKEIIKPSEARPYWQINIEDHIVIVVPITVMFDVTEIED